MMATFVESAIKGDPLPVMGRRRTVFRLHLHRRRRRCVHESPAEAATGKIIEIGTGISTTVVEVAKLIIELMGSKSKIEFKPLRTGEKNIRTKSDIADAKSYFG